MPIRLLYGILLAACLALTLIPGSREAERSIRESAEASHPDALPAVPHFPIDNDLPVSDLVNGLKSPDPKVRVQAAEALGKLGHKAVDAVPTLLDLTFDPRNHPLRNARQLDISNACRNAIVRIGQPAVPHLIGVLEDSTKSRRRQIMDLLGALASKHGSDSIASAVPPLIDALLDGLDANDPKFVTEAAQALGKARGHAEAAVPALEKALAWQNNQPFANPEIASALLGVAGPGHREAQAFFERFHRDMKLIESAQSGNRDQVKALLKAGANVNARYYTSAGHWGHHSYTALMHASVNGHVAVVRLLLDAGADPTMQRNGHTALDYANRKGHAAVVQLLEDASSRPRTILDDEQP